MRWIIAAVIAGLAIGVAPVALAAPSASVPSWLHVTRVTAAQARRWHLRGPCERVSAAGHHGFTVTCRDGQYRLFA